MELSNLSESSNITLENPRDSDMLNLKLLIKLTLPLKLMDNLLTKEKSKLILVLKDHITKKPILLKKKEKEEEIKMPTEKEDPEDKENNLEILNLEKEDNKNPELKFPENNQLHYLLET
jgi:hypothetical protein